LFLQRESLAVQVLGPQHEPQLLRLPARDAVEGLQRLGELPVQAGQAAAPVLAGLRAGRRAWRTVSKSLSISCLLTRFKQ